jgi:hypothetical protein
MLFIFSRSPMRLARSRHHNLKIVVRCDDLLSMRSYTFSHPRVEMNALSAIALAAMLLFTGCDPFRAAYAEKIVEGQQYAHYVRFPSNFQQPALPKEAAPGAVEPRFYFDHFGFRISATSPDVLLVAGCGYFGYTVHKELCSPNSFSIDTSRNYEIRATALGQWERANPITGAGGLRNPVIVKPYPGKIRRDGTANGEVSGWNYRGKSYYYRRGDDVRGSAFMSSADGGLVLLIGVNKQKLPKGGFIVGDAEGGGIYGNYTIDVFQANPAQRIALLDVDCSRASNDCMASISVANSRWFAVPLAINMSQALLFDFGR